MARNRLKIGLKQAADYAAAGLEVECFLVIEGEFEQEPKQRRKKKTHKKSIITTDETVYKCLGKSPEFAPGTDISYGYEQVLNLFRGGPEKRTRQQVRRHLMTHLGWTHIKAINTISALRQKGYLKVVQL